MHHAEEVLYSKNELKREMVEVAGGATHKKTVGDTLESNKI